jgi:hypothetical protein
VDRDGGVHVKRASASLAEDALLQVRRYRRYHLSWRQLRSGARLSSRRQIRAAIKAVRVGASGGCTIPWSGLSGRASVGLAQGGLVWIPTRTNCQYLARRCIVDLTDGARRAAAYASLMHVIQALLNQSQVTGALRFLTHHGLACGRTRSGAWARGWAGGVTVSPSLRVAASPIGNP